MKRKELSPPLARTLVRKRKLSKTMTALDQGRKGSTCNDHPSQETAICDKRTTFSNRHYPTGTIVEQRNIMTIEDSTTTKNSSCTFALDPAGPDTPELFLKKIMFHYYHLEIDDNKTAFSNIESGFFDTISAEEMQSYAAVVTAVRQNNVPELKRLLESGYSLNCCNSFGEALIHIACRRGFVDTVKLLLELPHVSIRLADDCGRTPLHDLCWNPSPQFELCRLLLEREPSLFFLKDKRNFSPFDYTREEHWPAWKSFILENKLLFEQMESDGRYDWIFSLKGDGATINTP